MYIQSWTHDDADELCVIAEIDMIAMDDVLRHIRFDDLKSQEWTLKLTDPTQSGLVRMRQDRRTHVLVWTIEGHWADYQGEERQCVARRRRCDEARRRETGLVCEDEEG